MSEFVFGVQLLKWKYDGCSTKYQQIDRDLYLWLAYEIPKMNWGYSCEFPRGKGVVVELLFFLIQGDLFDGVIELLLFVVWFVSCIFHSLAD